MKAPPTVTSALMRRYRLQRKLSLETASHQLKSSTAVLSRLECGLRAPTRDELRALTAVYALSPWESHSLFVSAGYLPDPPKRTSVEEVAQWRTLLGQLAYPGFVIDADGYMMMWNTQLQTLWMGNETRRVHVLESLWTPQARAVLGEAWQRQTQVAMWGFHLHTISSPQTRPNLAVLQHLAERCGADFIRLWNQAIDDGDAGRTGSNAFPGGNVYTVGSPSPAGIFDQVGMEIRYPVASGVVHYVVTQVGAKPLTAWGLYIWLPIDAESHERHQQVVRTHAREVIIAA